MTFRKNRTIPPATDQLGKASIFVAVVRSGSFSAAASDLGMARSTVSEHIRSLEASLGVRVIERTTRKLRLTEEGELLYGCMSSALEAWDDVYEALSERRSEPSGTLRVTSPGGLATAVVGPAMVKLLRDHPRVNAELLVDDRVRDLNVEAIDLAIRMGALTDSSMMVRTLGQDLRILIASQELADKLGSDDSAVDSAPWIGHSNVPKRTLDIYKDGTRREVRPNYRAHASTTEGEVSLVAGGIGIALMPSLLVREYIEDGRLIHFRPDLTGTPIAIHAVYPRGLMPRAKAFLDLLVQEIASVRA